MSQNIKSLHIKNFRIHKDTTIKDVKDVLFLVGKNNIGKSSILKVLDLLFNNTTMEAADITVGKEPSDVSFSIQLVDNSDTYTMDVALDGTSLRKSLRQNAAGITDPDAVLQRFKYTLFPAEGYTSKYLEPIAGRTVKEILDAKYNTIRTYPNYGKIKECWNNILGTYRNSQSTVQKQGTGLRRLLALFCFVMDNMVASGYQLGNKIIAIEEPEISLFPNQQRLLIDNLFDFSTLMEVQLIITAHSPYMVKEIDRVQQHKASIVSMRKSVKYNVTSSPARDPYIGILCQEQHRPPYRQRQCIPSSPCRIHQQQEVCRPACHTKVYRGTEEGDIRQPIIIPIAMPQTDSHTPATPPSVFQTSTTAGKP